MLEIPRTIKPIEGKNQFYPEGEFYIETYTGRNSKKNPPGIDEFSTAFKIRACYPYQTQALVDICLNPSDFDYLGINQEACKANRVFSLASQGAPLVITKIEESIIPINEIEYKVQFIIDVANKGKGDVRKIDAYYKECAGSESFEKSELDSFEIKEISFSDFSSLASGSQNIDCGPYDQIKLKDNKAKIVCSAKIKRSRGIFQTPLKVELDYGYTSIIEKNMKVKKIITQ